MNFAHRKPFLAFVVLFFFCCPSLHAQQRQKRKIDSLLLYLKKPLPDTSRIVAHLRLSHLYRNLRDIKTIEHANTALDLAVKTGIKTYMLRSYHSLGFSQAEMFQYSNALDSYLHAKELAEKLKDKKSLYSVVNALGNLYLYQKDHQKAIEHYEYALKLATEENHHFMMAAILNNIGEIYLDESELDKALDYHSRSLRLKQGYNDTKTGIGQSYTAIGQIHERKGDLKTAREHYYKALSAFRNDKDSYAICCSAMGRSYFNSGEMDSALYYVRKAFASDSARKNIYSLQVSANLLSEVYEKLNRHDLSLKYFRIHIAARDTLYNEKTTKGLIQKEMQFEFDRKKAELQTEQEKKELAMKYMREQENIKTENEKKEIAYKEALKREQIEFKNQREKQRLQLEKEKNEIVYRDNMLRKEQENTAQKRISYIFLSAFALMLLLSFFIYRGYHQKKKANLIISEQKLEVEKQKSLVEQKNKDILDSIQYAKRIQESLLPGEKFIDRILKQLRG